MEEVDCHVFDGRWEDAPSAYRVYFWYLMDPAAASSGGPVVWGCDERELRGASDIAEVLRWAEAHADGRRYTVYACVDRGDNQGMLQLLGDDPTVSTDT